MYDLTSCRLTSSLLYFLSISSLRTQSTQFSGSRRLLYFRLRSVFVTVEGGQYLGRVAVVLAMEGGRYLGVGERGDSREKLKER